MTKDLTAAAREFVETELFTDGRDHKARRLVFEYFEGEHPGTGWGMAPIADRVAGFAAQQTVALDKRVAELEDGLRTAIKLLEDHITPTDDDLGSLRALADAEAGKVGPDREGGLSYERQAGELTTNQSFSLEIRGN